MPPSLDPDSFLRLNEVRKAMWTAGFKGFLFGGIFGGAAHAAIHMNHTLLKKLKLPKHTFIPAVLLSSVIGSFLSATVAGKNAVPHIGDIFLEGADIKSTYKKQLHQNEQEIRESFDEAFARREAAIREAKLSKSFKGQ
jgi:hypothetical protein